MEHKQLFTNGQFIDSLSNSYFDIINPSTEELICKMINANQLDIDVSMNSSRNAFKTWKLTTGKQRAIMLRSISKIIADNKDEFCKVESNNVGKPYQEAVWDVDDTAACFEYYANLAEKLDEKQNTQTVTSNTMCTSTIRYEPKGVCVAILPFNYPLLMLTWKLAPALAAGCTIVCKPSEFTPMSTLLLAKLTAHILPPGVFNVITGNGATGGMLTATESHKVSFTGSSATGVKIATACAQQMRSCTLELGGKSPLILFADYIDNSTPESKEESIRQAAEWIMFGCFFNAGQVCSATSRVLIEESIMDVVLQKVVESASKLYIGNSSDPANKDKAGMVGPVVSKSQFEKIQGMLAEAKNEGAKVLVGGEAVKGTGYFIKPTVLVVNPNMKVWRDEVFGPVISVLPFTSEDEAIRLSNESVYGLGAAVFSLNESRLARVTASIESGIVWQNCSQPTLVEAPWGGVKRSGIGRECGQWGMDNFLDIKQVTKYSIKDPFTWFAPKL